MTRAGGLFATAVLLLVVGVVLRWELVDWLIDAVGFLFIIAGLGVGAVGLFRLMSGRKSGYSES